MNRLCVPGPRRGGIFKILRAIWTAPTNLLGHVVARVLGANEAERVGGAATTAYLYRLPDGRGRGIGAIAIGHVIVVEREFMRERRDWLLAHELSHTLQHDWLGPTYLVAHGLLQLISALAYKLAPVPGFPPQHAYNPLERVWICVPFDILTLEQPPNGPEANALLRAYGISKGSQPSRSPAAKVARD